MPLLVTGCGDDLAPGRGNEAGAASNGMAGSLGVVSSAGNLGVLPYANAMKTEASIKGIEVEDLNLRSGEYYESAGTAYLASNIFDGGTTHFIQPGAVKIASLIVGELRKNKGPLAAYLK